MEKRDEHGRRVAPCLGGCGKDTMMHWHGSGYMPDWCQGCLQWRQAAENVLRDIPSEKQRKWLFDEVAGRKV